MAFFAKINLYFGFRDKIVHAKTANLILTTQKENS